VQDAIIGDRLKPGDQLPTVRQLALELRVNFNTVARAYRMLDEAGLISTQQGRGTYILERPSTATQEKLRHELLNSLTQHYLEEAYRLGLTAEEVRQDFEREFQAWQEDGMKPEPVDEEKE
jgi:GntR family transcriptional regulator